jgi:hypothetical protein
LERDCFFLKTKKILPIPSYTLHGALPTLLRNMESRATENQSKGLTRSKCFAGIHARGLVPSGCEKQFRSIFASSGVNGLSKKARWNPLGKFRCVRPVSFANPMMEYRRSMLAHCLAWQGQSLRCSKRSQVCHTGRGYGCPSALPFALREYMLRVCWWRGMADGIEKLWELRSTGIPMRQNSRKRGKPITGETAKLVGQRR